MIGCLRHQTIPYHDLKVARCSADGATPGRSPPLSPESRTLVGLDAWGEAAVEARGKELLELAKKIWPRSAARRAGGEG